MRICYLANSGSIHFARWYQYFIDKGHEVFLISGDPAFLEYKLDIPELTVFHIPEKKLQNRILGFGLNLLKLPAIMAELRRLIKRISPDIIHAHQLYPYGFWGALSGFNPFITTPIGSDVIISAQKYFIYGQITKYVLRKSDIVTGDSFVLRNACAKYGLVEKDYHLIHNGVDLGKFTNSVDRNVVRKKMGILEDTPVIFYGRGFRPIYNLDKVLQAIPMVLSEFPDAKFILSHHCGDLGSKLNKLVETIGLEKSVIFTGLIQHEEMPLYIKSADICISVPSSDSSPSFVYESMACGVPTIISTLPWTELAMVHLENTYMIPEVKPKVIAEAIIKLIKDKKLCSEIVNGGLETVQKHFSYQVNMGKAEELMNNLLKKYSEKYKDNGKFIVQNHR